MSVTQYIGSRYVPLFADPIEWSSSNTYEPLTIVIHEGNSYTSKQAVPKGIDISNEAFWALTGNYNAQVELYRRETAAAKAAADDAQADADAAQAAADNAQSAADGAQADATAAQTDIDTLLPKANFSAVNTVKKYVDDTAANLRIRYYVRPEDYGAIGDGSADDAAAFAAMFGAMATQSANKCVHLANGATYKLGATVTINGANIEIAGNGATVESGGKTAFVISENSSGIYIHDINFSLSFTPDSDSPTNAAISVAGTSQTALYQASNIKIERCSFDGGVMGIAATSVMGIEIGHCEFGSFVYKPSDLAGGYGILTQSCVNVYIHDCNFTVGQYGRHCIYISVSQAKTENVESRNVIVDNCYMNYANLTLVSGRFYSPNISAINVRNVMEAMITNCVAVGGTACVSFTDVDGPIIATVDNCMTINSRYVSATASSGEARASFNLACSNTSDLIRLLNCKTVSPAASFLDASLAGGHVEYGFSDVAYQIVLNECEYLYIHDVKIIGAASLQYIGASTLHGKFERISGSGSYTYPRIVGNGTVDPDMYDTEAWTGIYLTGAGALRLPTKPHVPIAVAFDTATPDDLILTFAGFATRPFGLQFENTQPNAAKTFGFNYFDGNLEQNQVRVQMFDASGAKIVASANTHSCAISR